MFCLLAELKKAVHKEYKIDSFPLPICHNIRIKRCRLVKGEEYRGYNSSKRVYFYGFKVHCITAADGSIIEFEFFPGSYEDKVGFGLLNFDLPDQSEVFADKAYNYYYIREHELQEVGIDLQLLRKSNSKKLDNTVAHNFVRQHFRKDIETTFSVLQQLFPAKIHAVTVQEFLLKVIGFILVHNILIL